MHRSHVLAMPLRLAILAILPALLAVALGPIQSSRAGGDAPGGAEVFARGTANRLAYVHDDHWHGRINLELGQEREFDVRFVDHDDNAIPLGAGQSVRAMIAPGQPQGVVSIENHGDHFELTALAVGETRIVVHLWHDDHSDWSTPPLRVVVSAPATPEPTPTAPPATTTPPAATATPPAAGSPTVVATPTPRPPVTGTGHADGGRGPSVVLLLLGALALGGSVVVVASAGRRR